MRAVQQLDGAKQRVQPEALGGRGAPLVLRAVEEHLLLAQPSDQAGLPLLERLALRVRGGGGLGL